MIDFLTSKIGLAIVGIIMISTITGLFLYVDNKMDQIMINEISNALGDKINQINNINADTKLLIKFDRKTISNDDVSIYFPPSWKNQRYHFYFNQQLIKVTLNNKVSIARMSGDPHIWNPGDMKTITSDFIKIADNILYELEFNAGENFIIEKRQLYAPSPEYHLFIYPSKSVEPQRIMNEYSGYLNEITEFTIDTKDPIYNIGYTETLVTDPFVSKLSVYNDLIYCEIDGYPLIHHINFDHYWKPDIIPQNSIWTKEYIESRDSMVNTPGIIQPIFESETFFIQKVLVDYSEHIKEYPDRSISEDDFELVSHTGLKYMSFLYIA